MVMENSSDKSTSRKLEKESHKSRPRSGKAISTMVSKKRPKKQARPKKKILKSRSLAKEHVRKQTEDDVSGSASDELQRIKVDRAAANHDVDDEEEADEEDEDEDEDEEEQEVEEIKKPIIAIEASKTRRILQKELSLSEKVRLIKEHRDHKKSLRILASEFNIGKSTVSGILKRRDSIQKEHDATHNASDRCRKKRHTETELINDLVWKWYQITKSKDTPLSGPKIKTKARDYASDLGYDKFKASNGWLDTFKKTHGIRLPVLKIYGAVRELRNGGQRTRRPKPVESNKRRQRQVAQVELHNNSQWDTAGSQNSGASTLHIPQIFEPEILLQTRGTQASASLQQGYAHPHLQHQQPQQQHQQQHQQQQQQQQQQSSLTVPQVQHPTVTQQVLATQWNSSPDFQQPPPPPPPPPQPPQQQQQQHAGTSSQPASSSNGSSGNTGVDNSPQQMMNNLSGMYNYAMSKNDHSLANQVLHLKAAFEASIIHDRFASTRRQSNNGSYFW